MSAFSTRVARLILIRHTSRIAMVRAAALAADVTKAFRPRAWMTSPDPGPPAEAARPRPHVRPFKIAWPRLISIRPTSRVATVRRRPPAEAAQPRPRMSAFFKIAWPRLILIRPTSRVATVGAGDIATSPGLPTARLANLAGCQATARPRPPLPRPSMSAFSRSRGPSIVLIRLTSRIATSTAVRAASLAMLPGRTPRLGSADIADRHRPRLSAPPASRCRPAARHLDSADIAARRGRTGPPARPGDVALLRSVARLARYCPARRRLPWRARLGALAWPR
jgi:hypothetical protein